MVFVNIGCGMAPTEGWKNFDNSWSVRLARIPVLPSLLESLGFITDTQKAFINYVRRSDIKWADATKHIPVPDDLAEVVYSSHMLEHLDREEAISFMREARRILKPNGIIRIVVPDLRHLVENYLDDGNADRFIEQTLLAGKKPRSSLERIERMAAGERGHHWMYDSDSLCNFLLEAGFREPRALETGVTTIPNPGRLNLRERSPGSLYVEAVRP